MLWNQLLKKMGFSLFSLFVIITFTFFLMKVIPGDPFSDEQALPQEVIDNLKRHYGLDRPLYIQYFQYLRSIVTLDLGPSIRYQGRTVNQIIAEAFPTSAFLGMEALFLAVTLGISLGAFSAMYQNRWQDKAMVLFAILGVSIPSFILGAVLQYLFAFKLHVLPVARWGSFAHTVLPAISLAALPTAFIARLTRANMIEVMQQEYIKTAKAKGLSKRVIIFRHALKNALLPVIAYLGQITAHILIGSFVVEKIFAIPGLGQWIVWSVGNRDYPLIIGITLFYSALFLIIVFLVDLILNFLDPRIAKSQREGAYA